MLDYAAMAALLAAVLLAVAVAEWRARNRRDVWLLGTLFAGSLGGAALLWSL